MSTTPPFRGVFLSFISREVVNSVSFGPGAGAAVASGGVVPEGKEISVADQHRSAAGALPDGTGWGLQQPRPSGDAAIVVPPQAPEPFPPSRVLDRAVVPQVLVRSWFRKRTLPLSCTREARMVTKRVTIGEPFQP